MAVLPCLHPGLEGVIIVNEHIICFVEVHPVTMRLIGCDLSVGTDHGPRPWRGKTLERDLRVGWLPGGWRLVSPSMLDLNTTDEAEGGCWRGPRGGQQRGQDSKGGHVVGRSESGPGICGSCMAVVL